MTTQSHTQKNAQDLALEAIDIEIDAIQRIKRQIGPTFNQACDLILNNSGRVIVLGMGKSGHISHKIAATLASTGTAAFFVHPGEANHGDLGMITRHDIVLAISHSGETPEILSLLPLISHLNCPLIVISGHPHSRLAQKATIFLNAQIDREACPLGLAPTASTTATLVLGDALAVALLKKRAFTPADFARFHPGGSLGKRLTLHIEALMHSGDQLPITSPQCHVHDALIEMTSKRLGVTLITDQERLVGLFTDGDLRRTLETHTTSLHQLTMADVMTTTFETLPLDTLAYEALQLMQAKKITMLPIVEEGRLLGLIHIHDLLKAGLGDT